MPYVTRHGFGYSVFEHTAGGIHSELWVYVDLEDAGQVLGAEGAQWLGPHAAPVGHRLSSSGCSATCARNARMHVVTEIDAASGALFARNAYNTRILRAGSRSSTSTICRAR